MKGYMKGYNLQKGKKSTRPSMFNFFFCKIKSVFLLINGIQLILLTFFHPTVIACQSRFGYERRKKNVLEMYIVFCIHITYKGVGAPWDSGYAVSRRPVSRNRLALSSRHYNPSAPFFASAR